MIRELDSKEVRCVSGGWLRVLTLTAGTISGGFSGWIAAGNKSGADGWDIASGALTGAAVGYYSTLIFPVKGVVTTATVIRSIAQGLGGGLVGGAMKSTINDFKTYSGGSFGFGSSSIYGGGVGSFFDFDSGGSGLGLFGLEYSAYC